MSKAETEIRRTGVIQALGPGQVFRNLAQDFVEADKFGKTDAVYFGLGVSAENVKTIYGKNELTRQDYDKIPKYYKDGNEIKEYNNGKEIKEEYGKALNIINNLQTNYGINAYSAGARNDLNAKLIKEIESLKALYRVEDYPETLSNSKMTSSYRAIRDMQDHLLKMNADANLPAELKKQVESALSSIRVMQNPNVPLEKVYEVSIGELSRPNIPPLEVDKLSKIVRKDIDSVLKSAAEQNISNPNIKALAIIQAEDVTLRMSEGPDYARKLNRTRQITANIEALSTEMSKLTPLAYSGATISIKGSKPTKEEMVKAYTQLIIEQQAITGINPTDKDFHTKVKALDPKTLGKIEVSFQGDPPNGKILQYSIDNKKFVKALKKIDQPEILELSKSVTFKTSFRDIPDYSINTNTLLQQLKERDPVKYGKLTGEDLKDVAVELKIKELSTLTKADKDKAPIEKANEQNLKDLYDTSISKSTFKGQIGSSPDNIESAKLTFIDKSGSKQELTLTVDQLVQLKKNINPISAAEVTFASLPPNEKNMAIADIKNAVGKRNSESMMKLEKDNLEEASKSTYEKSTIQASEPVSVVKDPIQPKATPPNLVFPADALEEFRKAQLKDINITEKVTKLGIKDFIIDIPKTAASTLMPTPLNKSDEDLKQKLQARPIITQEGLTAKPALKTPSIQTSTPELAPSSDEKAKPATKAFELNIPKVAPYAQTQTVLSKENEEPKKRLQKRVDSTQSNITAQPAPRTVEGPVTKSGMKPLLPIPAASIDSSKSMLQPLSENTQRSEQPAGLAQKNQAPSSTLGKKPLPIIPPQSPTLANITSLQTADGTAPAKNPFPPIPPGLAQILRGDGMKVPADQKTLKPSNTTVRVGTHRNNKDTHNKDSNGR